MKSDITSPDPISAVSEELLNQKFGALGIIIDRRPKRRPRKIEN